MNSGYKYTEEQWKAITNADCIETAKALGYEFDEKRSDKSALRIKENGGLFVWKSGKGFYQHSTGDKGRAIELVMKANGCNYISAMDFIFSNVLRRSDYEINLQKHSDYNKPNKEKFEKEYIEFVLPKQEEGKPSRVYAYLSYTRCISRKVIEEAFEKKILYQDSKFGNCCFVGYDKDNVPRYCSKRGTNTDIQFRGEVTGSDKKFGWKLQGSNETGAKLYIFEAPIDAMSHASLNQLAGRDWRQDTRLSMGGCSMLAVDQHLKDYPGKYSEIVICTDNDEAGNKMAGIISEKLSGEYKVTRRSSVSKDWNEDLTRISKLAADYKTSMENAMSIYYSRSCRHTEKEQEAAEEDYLEAEP